MHLLASKWDQLTDRKPRQEVRGQGREERGARVLIPAPTCLVLALAVFAQAPLRALPQASATLAPSPGLPMGPALTHH